MDTPTAYMGLGKVFAYGDMRRLSLAALQAAPDGLDTRQLAEALMQARGVGINEKAFRRTVVRSLAVTLAKMERRGLVLCVGERRRAKVWQVDLLN